MELFGYVISTVSASDVYLVPVSMCCYKTLRDYPNYNFCPECGQNIKNMTLTKDEEDV